MKGKFMRHRRAQIAGLAAFVGIAAWAGTAAVAAPEGVNTAAAPAAHSALKPTVVLVHGAFADSSSWNDVVRTLQGRGYPVIAPANPLRGLPSDSAYVASVLRSIDGPVVLVGHSYGGEVITNAAASNSQVKALVYLAAVAPDKGESANDVLGKFPGSKLGEVLNPRPYPKADGSTGTDLYIKPDKFREAFASDVPASTAAMMAATQRPIEASSLSDLSQSAAWKTIPSWYLVATDDQAIPVAAQRFMAERAGARTVEVDSAHAVAVSHPLETANLIVDAARATIR
ncbi:alpha/beta hydrolase [Streptomyces sp. NPDC126514]|uniref:alpha/beta fold hydrolase n=1 Tax=Streptomyces sp. NPDC126514 TaxID=3155210 RepID=UPI00332040AD